MIHLVVREPISYQVVLGRVLHDWQNGEFVAWFHKGDVQDLRSEIPFTHHYLSETGYRKLFDALRADDAAVVILGGWSSPMTARTLLMSTLLRRRAFIWADHPHPRKRIWIKEQARTAYLRMLASTVVDGFLVCGQPTMKYLEKLGIGDDQLTNFPYWIDIPAAWSLPKRCNSGEADTPFRLAAIGRHVSVKGFDVAIRAVERVNHRAGTALCNLTLIGDGPERVRLESLVHSLNAGPSITFTGWQSNDRVRSALSEADALVVPSNFEPYGVVVLEALAAGRPVFASDQTIAALDRDDGSGAIRFHRAGDFETLAQQIGTLISDRDAFTTSCYAARAIAEQWPADRAVPILQEAIDMSAGNYREVSAHGSVDGIPPESPVL